MTVSIKVSGLYVVGIVTDTCGAISEERKEEIKDANFDDIMVQSSSCC